MSFGNTKGDGSGTAKWLHVTSDGDLVSGEHPGLQSSETSNDSDITLTVPALTEWEILTIWVELVTDATVGNRQVAIEIQDSAADVILRISAGIVQAASLTRNYAFGHGLQDLTAFRDTAYLTTPLPKIILPPAYIVRVLDSAAIAAATDDMVVQMLVMARSNP